MSAYVAVADPQIALSKASAGASYRLNTKRRQWENWSQAGKSHDLPRKELDPKPLHTRRMELAIEACARILGIMRSCGRTALAARMSTTQ